MRQRLPIISVTSGRYEALKCGNWRITAYWQTLEILLILNLKWNLDIQSLIAQVTIQYPIFQTISSIKLSISFMSKVNLLALGVFCVAVLSYIHFFSEHKAVGAVKFERSEYNFGVVSAYNPQTLSLVIANNSNHTVTITDVRPSVVYSKFIEKFSCSTGRLTSHFLLSSLRPFCKRTSGTPH